MDRLHADPGADKRRTDQNDLVNAPQWTLNHKIKSIDVQIVNRLVVGATANLLAVRPSRVALLPCPRFRPQGHRIKNTAGKPAVAPIALNS